MAYLLTAPETLNSLPAENLGEIVEDTSAGHKNHIFDRNCKICVSQSDSTIASEELVGYLLYFILWLFVFLYIFVCTLV